MNLKGYVLKYNIKYNSLCRVVEGMVEGKNIAGKPP